MPAKAKVAPPKSKRKKLTIAGLARDFAMLEAMRQEQNGVIRAANNDINAIFRKLEAIDTRLDNAARNLQAQIDANGKQNAELNQLKVKDRLDGHAKLIVTMHGQVLQLERDKNLWKETHNDLVRRVYQLEAANKGGAEAATTDRPAETTARGLDPHYLVGYKVDGFRAIRMYPDHRTMTDGEAARSASMYYRDYIMPLFVCRAKSEREALGIFADHLMDGGRVIQVAA